MKLKLSIILLLFFILVYSCIEPLDFNIIGDKSKSLVVDGLITNEPGPYVVYLTRTTNYSSTFEFSEKVGGAIVIISDNLGNSETLIQTFPGMYKTYPGSIRGIPGRYYKIEIETPDGKHYESKPELLSCVSEIDSIYYELQQHQELDDNNIVQSFEGFQISIDINNAENDKNYYMWSWTGTHEIHTQPWNYMDGRSPAPKDFCSTCWISERQQYINVFNDENLSGNQIKKKPVAFVRITDSDGNRHFRGKYHIEVKQLSISKEAYKYWSSIEKQISSTGSLFDPSPSAIIGNIKNVNEPEDIIFGYFGASAISTKSIFIPADEAPYHPGDTLIWPDDCRSLLNSTARKPSFW